MKYRKKPVVIDAVQWTGTNHREMFDFLTDYQCTDQYMSAEGKNFYIDHWKVPGGLVIKTLEGEHLANIGDYIIRGVHGEFYPCKPDTGTKRNMGILNGTNIRTDTAEQGCIKLSPGRHFQSYIRRAKWDIVN